MGLEVKALHVGDVGIDWSWLIFQLYPGRKTWIPVNAFLIKGAKTPVLVDIGMSHPDIFHAFGLATSEKPEQDIRKLVREQGVEPEDIGYVFITHLHGDHAGKPELFPNARFVIQRKEMGFAAAEYMPGQCPNFPWFVNNIGRVEFIDGDIEFFPGIKAVLSPAHTGGHQHVEVETDEGKAIMCGDTVYDIQIQLEGKHPLVAPTVIAPTGNFNDQGALQWQLYKMKKELEKGSMILPTHDYLVFDRWKLGKRKADPSIFKRDLKGMPASQWPLKYFPY